MSRNSGNPPRRILCLFQTAGADVHAQARQREAKRQSAALCASAAYYCNARLHKSF
jgi:hypothetical protein